MGFNDQNDALGGRGARKFIFKEGVRYKHMTGQAAIIFRLMPAFNPADPNPGTSWVPCLDKNGKLTEWGTYLRIVRFVGHGKGGATRQDLLSLKTFETPNRPVWDPLDALYQTINADMQTWGYLIDEGDRKDKNRPRPAFGRGVNLLVCNVLDINQTQHGVQLGVFTTGAANKLVGKGDGLVFQPNASPGIEEAVKQNHMWAYANGDITDPNHAPVFVVEKDNDKGEFSAYKITIAQDQARRVIRRPVDQLLMAQRYNLGQMDTFINIPTEDDLIQSLIQLLNMRSPMGYHEHALLRIAFPNHQIPEPPAAPAAMPTVQAGMSFQQGGGFPVSAGAVPGMVPTGTYAGVPTQALSGASAPVPPIPGMVPGAVPGAVPGTVPGAVPGMVPGMVPGAVPGMVPGAVPGMVTPPITAPAQAPAPEVAGVAANIAAAGAEPVAPGDPVSGFDQAAFLTRIRGGQPQ